MRAEAGGSVSTIELGFSIINRKAGKAGVRITSEAW